MVLLASAEVCMSCEPEIMWNSAGMAVDVRVMKNNDNIVKRQGGVRSIRDDC